MDQVRWLEDVDMNKFLLFFLLFSLIIISSCGSPTGDTVKDTDKEIVENSESEIMITYNSLSPKARSLYYKQSESLTKEVDPRVVELDQLTIGCFGTNTIMRMSEEDTNLGGQCCGALVDVETYKIQLQALNKFIEENNNINIIPKDPYDISVDHAQKLITFNKDIILLSTQQQIYNDAMKMSHHGGPCCCKCWKWYMMSGLGKKLIVDYSWNAEQLAELWDLSSSCGHDGDTNMHEHYENELDHGDEHAN